MPARSQDTTSAVLDAEARPTAPACRLLDAGDPAACDFPTEWTIAPPGASDDDGPGSGLDVGPEPEVLQTARHTT